MPDFTAITLGMGLITFFAYWVSFKLMDTDKHEAYALFSFLFGTVTLWGLAAFVRFSVIRTGGLSDFHGAIDALYYGVVVYGLITFVYFILRVMIAPIVAANKKKRFKLE